MRDIAREAGVAVQTIYSSIGAKRAILSAFIDQMEEEAGLGAASEDLLSTQSPGEMLDIRARTSRQIFDAGMETIEMLMRSAGTAPEIQETLDEGDHRHLESIRELITGRWDEAALREGLSRDEATELIAALSGSDVYRWLVRRYGWPSSTYEAWLARNLRQAVLRDPDC